MYGKEYIEWMEMPEVQRSYRDLLKMPNFGLAFLRRILQTFPEIKTFQDFHDALIDGRVESLRGFRTSSNPSWWARWMEEEGLALPSTANISDAQLKARKFAPWSYPPQ